MTISINVSFYGCVSESDARTNIFDALENMTDFDTEGTQFINPVACPKNRKKRSSDPIKAIIVKTNVRAREFFGNQSNFTSEIESAINDAVNASAVQVGGASKLTMCDTDVCQQASRKYKGFTCNSNNDSSSNCTFQSPCTIYKCGEYGICHVKTDGLNYVHLCSCQEEDMYKYTVSEAGKCEKGDLSYKAWMIIAAGAGGLIILILLFAIVIQCARRKREPFIPEKYAFDEGDRETLVQDRSYDHIDQYHRKPSFKVEDRRIQTSLQTFDNQGYDHWDPDESKETYQSMDRHFQSPNFQTQITRPKLTTSRYGEDKLTPF